MLGMASATKLTTAAAPATIQCASVLRRTHQKYADNDDEGSFAKLLKYRQRLFYLTSLCFYPTAKGVRWRSRGTKRRVGL
jgi:hypothetical protein